MLSRSLAVSLSSSLAYLAVACSAAIGQQAGDAPKLSQQLMSEGAAALAEAAREKGDAVRGAILFPQQKLACANCHSPGGADLLGPDLTQLKNQVTDAYLVESLLNPSKDIAKGFETISVVTVRGRKHSGRIVRRTPAVIVLREAIEERRLITLRLADIEEQLTQPKSSMPDGMVDELPSRQHFLDLVRYVMEIRGAGGGASRVQSGGGTIDARLHGLVLIDHFQCGACHGGDAVTAATTFGPPPQEAPDLMWSAGRLDPEYIEQLLHSPHKTKPGARMPDVLGSLSKRERVAAANQLTHFVASLRPEKFNRPSPFVFEGEGKTLFHTVGCAACHSPRNDEGLETLADSSVPLGDVTRKYNLNSLREFLEDPHAARPGGRMPNLKLTHFEAKDIAGYLLSVPAPAFVSQFELDAEKVAAGRLQFEQLGCAECHALDKNRRPIKHAQLAADNATKGCLSGKPGKWPAYQLSDRQRSAMVTALQSPLEPIGEADRIDMTLTALRCTACHQRGELGGIGAERNEFFHTANPNLGPQGRIPPPLTDVGSKLRPKWMREVLVSGRSVRPYMMTRMPQYGVDNVAHLIDLFQRVDEAAPVSYAPVKDEKEIRNAGHQMAGVGGLNCIACHTFQQKRASTMPAADLTEMTDRLHKGWFYRYMRDPQKLSPNTVMPSFWPGGRAIRQDLLEGNTDLQIEAMWRYLLDGRQARVPRGLRREPIELVATDEAVMLRRSYQGIGKRGIGVGYPRRVNLAFDAEQLRLAMIWKGKFADPSGVWRSQGHGTVRPLGSDHLRFPKGPELDDAEKPWVVDEGRPPHHRFKGYVLDKLRRPTFLYRFDNIDVTDSPIDMSSGGDGDEPRRAWIKRTLTFASTEGRRPVVFRAAADANIADRGDGVFSVGKRLRIHVSGDRTARIVKAGNGQQLRIPVEIPAGKSSLTLEYHW